MLFDSALMTVRTPLVPVFRAAPQRRASASERRHLDSLLLQLLKADTDHLLREGDDGRAAQSAATGSARML